MSPAPPSTNKHLHTAPARRPSLRSIRIQQGLSQKALGDLCGMHRNSIRKIETGRTKEITEQHAIALAAALHIDVDELGLHVRSAVVDPPSVRFRQLTPEQRQLVSEVLALPPSEYVVIRQAMEHLRDRNSKRKSRKGAR
jgi:transcriptional regulator with XRE-family HTH domain